MQKEKHLTYERCRRSFLATLSTIYSLTRKPPQQSPPAHCTTFPLLCILTMGFMVLQITYTVQEANVGM